VAGLARTFDTVADRYDAARPGYPEELYDNLIELAALRPGACLLEVGCGTGKATLPLLERGYRVVCVELGERLAAQARRNLAGRDAEIHVGRFERWRSDPARFELVYAATAWHWLDPELRYRRAYELLREGGHLAIWSAAHAFPEGFDPFFAEIQRTYDELGESYPGEWPPPPPEEAPDLRAEIEGSGLFAGTEVRRFVWEQRYTADEYIALLDTFSDHIAMEAQKRRRLDDAIRSLLAARPDGTVRRHWLAILHVARRVG
jgi:SAM-dependent methyltransferase